MRDNEFFSKDTQTLLSTLIKNNNINFKSFAFGVVNEKVKDLVYRVSLFPKLKGSRKQEIECVSIVDIDSDNFNSKKYVIAFTDLPSKNFYLLDDKSDISDSYMHSISNGVILNFDDLADGFDYNKASNKPQINGVELKGNKSLGELGINIPDVSGFITEEDADRKYQTITHLYRYIIQFDQFWKSDVGNIEGWIAFEVLSTTPPEDLDIEMVNNEVQSLSSSAIQKVRQWLCDQAGPYNSRRFSRIANGQIWTSNRSSRLVWLENIYFWNNNYNIEVTGYGDSPLTNTFVLQLSNNTKVTACNKLF